jgi:dTDP-4-dehydrorhamnose reductase
MTRVLLLGASGQLGTEILRARLPAGWTIVAAERGVFDLADPPRLREATITARPDAIINAAAYTAVDKAESEPTLAFLLNRDAPAALAEAAREIDAPIILVSTDYVFDGKKSAPYVETDPIGPTSVYGASKAEGETALMQHAPRAAVLRTSWVYSSHRANFVKTMLRLGETRDEVSVVADQLGRPTAAGDLAAACIAMTERLLARDAAAQGTFHYSGAGDATWADFADAIFAGAADRGRNAVAVRRITTAEYPTAAKRPANSRLDTSKIEALGIAPRTWRDALNVCLDELLER